VQADSGFTESDDLPPPRTLDRIVNSRRARLKQARARRRAGYPSISQAIAPVYPMARYPM
jgi:hypothetical protein